MNKMKYWKKINYSKARESFEKLKAIQKTQVHKVLAVSTCLIFRLSEPLLWLPDRYDLRESWQYPVLESSYPQAAPPPVKLLNSNRTVCPKSIFYYCGCIKNACGQNMFIFIISVTFWNTSAESASLFIQQICEHLLWARYGSEEKKSSFHRAYLLVFLSKYVNKNSHFKSAQLVFKQVTFPEQPP